MKLHTDSQMAHAIHSWEPGRLCIGEQDHHTHLIVSPTEIVTSWSPVNPRALTLNDLETALSFAPEILILGTGVRQRFPSQGVIYDILQKGVGFEVMNTGAACRTFNVLLSEYRHVVGVFLLE